MNAEPNKPAAEVLVIDDDAIMRDLVADWLEAAGYRVRKATSCRAWIEQFFPLKSSPDLIVTDPARAAIRRGDILVARNTDPGWTPVLSAVGGLVIEEGGLLNHCSIVARELRIPAVVGIPRATSVIRTRFPAIGCSLRLRLVVPLASRALRRGRSSLYSGAG